MAMDTSIEQDHALVLDNSSATKKGRSASKKSISSSQSISPTQHSSPNTKSSSSKRRSSTGEKTALVQEPEQQDEWNSSRYLLIGYSMVFLHALCMTASSASVQALANKVPHFELVLMRFLTLTLVATGFLLAKRESPKILGERKTQGLLILAAVINTTTFTLYYASSYFISLGPIGGLYRATTLIVSIFLAKCLLKEGVNGVKVIAIITSIIGMVLIVFPAIIDAEVVAVREAEQGNKATTVVEIKAPAAFDDLLGLNQSAAVPVLEYVSEDGRHNNGSSNGATSKNSTSSDDAIDGANNLGKSRRVMPRFPPRMKVLGYLLILVAGLFNSAELILLSGYLRSINPTVQAFWFGVFGTIISATIMILTETPTLPNTNTNIILFLLHGVGAAMSIFSFIFALKYLQASNTAITQSVHIVLMYIAQWTIMNRWNAVFVTFVNLAQLVGTILTLIGVLTLPVSDIVKYRLYKKHREEI